jgi:hypothetical protein
MNEENDEINGLRNGTTPRKNISEHQTKHT